MSPLSCNPGPLLAAIWAYEWTLHWEQVGWPLRRQAPAHSSKRLPLMLESCGSSVPGNCKLMTDLVLDLNTRPRVDSQGLPPRGVGISMRIKQESAESGEPVVAGNGKSGILCVCVCVCVFILVCRRCGSMCCYVLKTPFVSD